MTELDKIYNQKINVAVGNETYQFVLSQTANVLQSIVLSEIRHQYKQVFDEYSKNNIITSLNNFNYSVIFRILNKKYKCDDYFDFANLFDDIFSSIKGIRIIFNKFYILFNGYKYQDTFTDEINIVLNKYRAFISSYSNEYANLSKLKTLAILLLKDKLPADDSYEQAKQLINYIEKNISIVNNIMPVLKIIKNIYNVIYDPDFSYKIEFSAYKNYKNEDERRNATLSEIGIYFSKLRYKLVNIKDEDAKQEIIVHTHKFLADYNSFGEYIRDDFVIDDKIISSYLTLMLDIWQKISLDIK